MTTEQLARAFAQGFDVGRAGGTPDDRLEAAFRLGYFAGLHDAEEAAARSSWRPPERRLRVVP